MAGPSYASLLAATAIAPAAPLVVSLVAAAALARGGAGDRAHNHRRPWVLGRCVVVLAMRLGGWRTPSHAGRAVAAARPPAARGRCS